MRSLRPIGMLCLVAGLVSTAAGQIQELRVGSTFPDFTARDVAFGRDFKLSDLRGKIVVVDFWATWCGPCVKELPNVKAVYKDYHDQGLEIVSISLDSSISKAKKFVKDQNLRWYHVIEGGKWDTRLAKKYRIQSIPTMYVLDITGKIVAAKPRGRELSRAIAQAIKKTPPVLTKQPGPPVTPTDDAREAESDDSAEPFADEVIGDPKLTPEEQLVRGRALLEREQFTAAAQIFESLIRRYPASKAGVAARAQLGKMQSDERISQVLKNDASKRKEDQARRKRQTLLEQARSLARNGQNELARNYYRQLIDAHPGSEEARTARKELKAIKD